MELRRGQDAAGDAVTQAGGKIRGDLDVRPPAREKAGEECCGLRWFERFVSALERSMVPVQQSHAPEGGPAFRWGGSSQVHEERKAETKVAKVILDIPGMFLTAKAAEKEPVGSARLADCLQSRAMRLELAPHSPSGEIVNRKRPAGKLGEVQRLQANLSPVARAIKHGHREPGRESREFRKPASNLPPGSRSLKKLIHPGWRCLHESTWSKY